MKLTKNRYLQGFAIAVVLLAIIRLVFPEVAEGERNQQAEAVDSLLTDEVPTAEESSVTAEKAPVAAEKTAIPKRKAAHRKSGL